MAAKIAKYSLFIVCLLLVLILIRFAVEHERLPMGSGEVWNWLFGWGNG